jgi:hypothetical protein
MGTSAWCLFILLYATLALTLYMENPICPEGKMLVTEEKNMKRGQKKEERRNGTENMYRKNLGKSEKKFQKTYSLVGCKYRYLLDLYIYVLLKESFIALSK